MKKTLTKWIIAAAALVFIATVIIIFVRNRHKETPSVSVAEGAPIYVSYNTGGGMDGSRYLLTFSLNDGEALVIRETQEHAGAKTKTEKKKVDAKCADSLKDIFDFYKIDEWTAEESDFFALDAATTSISFMFANGTTYTFSNSSKLPDGADDAFHDVRYCMLEYAGMEMK